jgi:hypothetical protein
MDDFVVSNLHESRNEWCSRLVGIVCPLVIEGIRSIYNEAWKLCVDNNEANKYLMTFQNLLTRVPKWNNQIIEQERKRIIERSGCNYLEDLITCVHIIQLKILTCIRVGNRQKKIDISIPKLDNFIHKVYINTARKVYSNVYLFDKNITPLQYQKYNRELEILVQESILISVRESIPTEEIIRSYMDESVEQEEEVTVETIDEPTDAAASGGTAIETKEEVPINDTAIGNSETPPIVPTIKDIDEEPVITRLTFNNVGQDYDEIKKREALDTPSKTLERLEQMASSREMERKLDEIPMDDNRLKIMTDSIDLSGFEDLDELTTENKKTSITDDFSLNDVEELF